MNAKGATLRFTGLLAGAAHKPPQAQKNPPAREHTLRCHPASWPGAARKPPQARRILQRENTPCAAPRPLGRGQRVSRRRPEGLRRRESQIRLRFRRSLGGVSMRRWSSRGIGGLLLFAAGRGGGGSLIPV